MANYLNIFIRKLFGGGLEVKKFFLFLSVFCFLFIFVPNAYGATYYVDATEGNDANDGLTTVTAWQTIAKVNALDPSPGDSILFQRGESWTEMLTATSSGEVGNLITYADYGEGEKPYINVTGLSLNAAISITDLNYIKVENFKLAGGIGGSFHTGGTTGSTGDGYTIEVENVDVVSNSESDGFDQTGSSEVIYRDITATEIHPVPIANRSDQALTLHETAKAKVYGATFTNNNYGISNVGDSYFYGESLTITDSYAKSVNISGTSYGRITNSTITSNQDDITGGISSTGDAGSELVIDNSTINVNLDGGYYDYQFGTLTLDNNTFNIDISHDWVAKLGATINAYNNTFTIASSVGGYLFWTESGGTINFYNNYITQTGVTGFSVFRCESGGTGSFKNNIIKTFNPTLGIIWAKAGCLIPSVINNTLYNSPKAGTFIRNEGVAALSMSNNIFHGTNLVVTADTNITYTNNIYYNSSNEGGTGSVTSDPLLSNPGTDFTLTQLSPSIDAGTSVSLTTDYLGNPIYGIPDIGAYEYQPPYTVGTNLPSTDASLRLYKNGKYRYKTATSTSNLASFSVSPSAGFTAGNYSELMDISIANWETAGDYSKYWTESSSAIGSGITSHTIGNLEPNTYYTVSYQKAGSASSTLSILQANASGEITFDYTGGYSTVDFSIEEDLSVPVFSGGTPAGQLSAGTKSTVLSLQTDETATCRFSLLPDTAFSSMTGVFTTTGATSHSSILSGLDDGVSYNFFVRCQDSAGNTNTVDYAISFSVASADGVARPPASGGGGSPAPIPLSSPVPTPSVEKPISQMTAFELQAKIQELISQMNQIKNQLSSKILTQNLSLGDKSDQVKVLQQFLQSQGPAVYPEGLITGYFGQFTKKAVIRFQEKYKEEILLPSGLSRGTGYVGKSTRAKINVLIAD